MVPLTESEKNELNRLLRLDQPLPEHWRHRLFPCGRHVQETGKEYRLVYDGKLKREEVLAQTLATDPEDFQNFETFSIALVDLDYDGDVFRLSWMF